MGVFCLSDADIQKNYRTFFQDGWHRSKLRVQNNKWKKKKKNLTIMLDFIQ